MSKRKGKSRDIDNRRLMSLMTGETYVPALDRHVPWEGHGERALSIVGARLPGLTSMVSQPDKLKLSQRWWHPDYELRASKLMPLTVELKGHQELKEPSVQDKLAQAELAVAAAGGRLLVFDSRRLAYSTELRNTQVLRRYARREVAPELVESVLSGFRTTPSVALGVLVAASERVGVFREDIYALLYRGVLDMDWSEFLDDATAVFVATPLPNPELLPTWLTNLLSWPLNPGGKS